MKKRIIIPKVTKIFFVLTIVFSGLTVALEVLSKNHIYLYINALDLNITSFKSLFAIFGMFSLVGVIIGILVCSLKSNVLKSVLIVLLLIIPVWVGLITLAFYSKDNYYEFISTDNKHTIIAREGSFLHSVQINFYEKTSEFTMQKIGDASTEYNHVLENNDYKFFWNDTGFEFHYDFSGSEEYKVEKIEYCN